MLSPPPGLSAGVTVYPAELKETTKTKQQSDSKNGKIITDTGLEQVRENKIQVKDIFGAMVMIIIWAAMELHKTTKCVSRNCRVINRNRNSKNNLMNFLMRGQKSTHGTTAQEQAIQSVMSGHSVHHVQS